MVISLHLRSSKIAEVCSSSTTAHYILYSTNLKKKVLLKESGSRKAPNEKENTIDSALREENTGCVIIIAGNCFLNPCSILSEKNKMNRFSSLLSNIEKKLDLPQPAKSRILLELAADMGDFYSYLRECGLTENDAVRKVEDRFMFSDEAISELKQVHQTFYDKLVYRLTKQAQARWEKAILLMTFLTITILSGNEFFTTDFFRRSSIFIYPVVGTGLTAMFLYLRKFYSLYIKKDHGIRTLRSGIIPILILSGASLILGISGYLIELLQTGEYALTIDTILFSAVLLPASDISLQYIAEWFLKCSSMVMTSLFISMLSGLFWFILIRAVHKIEQANIQHLFGEQA